MASTIVQDSSKVVNELKIKLQNLISHFQIPSLNDTINTYNDQIGYFLNSDKVGAFLNTLGRNETDVKPRVVIIPRPNNQSVAIPYILYQSLMIDRCFKLDNDKTSRVLYLLDHSYALIHYLIDQFKPTHKIISGQSIRNIILVTYLPYKRSDIDLMNGIIDYILQPDKDIPHLLTNQQLLKEPRLLASDNISYTLNAKSKSYAEEKVKITGLQAALTYARGTVEERAFAESKVREAEEAAQIMAAKEAADAREAAEVKRLADAAEAKAKADAEAETQRLAAKAKADAEAETQRLAAKAKADAEAERQRLAAEAKAAAAEADRQRLAEAKAAAAEAERQRLAEAKAAAAAERQRLAEAKAAAAAAERQRLAEAERQRLAEAEAAAEAERQRLVAAEAERQRLVAAELDKQRQDAAKKKAVECLAKYEKFTNGPEDTLSGLMQTLQATISDVDVDAVNKMVPLITSFGDIYDCLDKLAASLRNDVNSRISGIPYKSEDFAYVYDIIQQLKGLHNIYPSDTIIEAYKYSMRTYYSEVLSLAKLCKSGHNLSSSKVEALLKHLDVLEDIIDKGSVRTEEFYRNSLFSRSNNDSSISSEVLPSNGVNPLYDPYASSPPNPDGLGVDINKLENLVEVSKVVIYMVMIIEAYAKIDAELTAEALRKEVDDAKITNGKNLWNQLYNLDLLHHFDQTIQQGDDDVFRYLDDNSIVITYMVQLQKAYDAVKNALKEEFSKLMSKVRDLDNKAATLRGSFRSAKLVAMFAAIAAVKAAIAVIENGGDGGKLEAETTANTSADNAQQAVEAAQQLSDASKLSLDASEALYKYALITNHSGITDIQKLYEDHMSVYLKNQIALEKATLAAKEAKEHAENIKNLLATYQRAQTCVILYNNHTNAHVREMVAALSRTMMVDKLEPLEFARIVDPDDVKGESEVIKKQVDELSTKGDILRDIRKNIKIISWMVELIEKYAIVVDRQEQTTVETAIVNIKIAHGKVLLEQLRKYGLHTRFGFDETIDPSASMLIYLSDNSLIIKHMIDIQEAYDKAKEQSSIDAEVMIERTIRSIKIAHGTVLRAEILERVGHDPSELLATYTFLEINNADDTLVGLSDASKIIAFILQLFDAYYKAHVQIPPDGSHTPVGHVIDPADETVTGQKAEDITLEKPQLEDTSGNLLDILKKAVKERLDPESDLNTIRAAETTYGDCMVKFVMQKKQFVYQDPPRTKKAFDKILERYIGDVNVHPINIQEVWENGGSRVAALVTKDPKVADVAVAAWKFIIDHDLKSGGIADVFNVLPRMEELIAKLPSDDSTESALTKYFEDCSKTLMYKIATFAHGNARAILIHEHDWDSATGVITEVSTQPQLQPSLTSPISQVSSPISQVSSTTSQVASLASRASSTASQRTAPPSLKLTVPEQYLIDLQDAYNFAKLTVPEQYFIKLQAAYELAKQTTSPLQPITPNDLLTDFNFAPFDTNYTTTCYKFKNYTFQLTISERVHAMDTFMSKYTDVSFLDTFGIRTIEVMYNSEIVACIAFRIDINTATFKIVTCAIRSVYSPNIQNIYTVLIGLIIQLAKQNNYKFVLAPKTSLFISPKKLKGLLGFTEYASDSAYLAFDVSKQYTDACSIDPPSLPPTHPPPIPPPMIPPAPPPSPPHPPVEQPVVACEAKAQLINNHNSCYMDSLLVALFNKKNGYLDQMIDPPTVADTKPVKQLRDALRDTVNAIRGGTATYDNKCTTLRLAFQNAYSANETNVEYDFTTAQESPDDLFRTMCKILIPEDDIRMQMEAYNPVGDILQSEIISIKPATEDIQEHVRANVHNSPILYISNSIYNSNSDTGVLYPYNAISKAPYSVDYGNESVHLLSAIITFSGTFKSGHYTCYYLCEEGNNDSWYFYNDISTPKTINVGNYNNMYANMMSESLYPTAFVYI